jgi:hypothetical protein
MAAKKQVRIIKKIRDTDGVWRFVSLDQAGKKYAPNTARRSGRAK